MKLHCGFLVVAPAQWASEPGFAVVQQQCMKCHGKENMPQAAGVPALRELTGERIYEILTTTQSHKALSLGEDDKRHVAESLMWDRDIVLGAGIGTETLSLPSRFSRHRSRCGGGGNGR